jgi:hypothetical protein
MELAEKMRSCALIEISINKESRATIHAPTAKKKSMNPGKANSRIKKTNPTMNHKTAGLLKLCISS